MLTATILVANAGWWCQVLHQDMSRMPDLSDAEAPHSTYYSSSGQIIPQGPHWHNGNAAFWQILIHCPSLMHTYSVSRMVDVMIWECVCHHILHFWGHTLSLGHCFQVGHWQWYSLRTGAWYPSKPIWNLPYLDLPLQLTGKWYGWMASLQCLGGHHQKFPEERGLLASNFSLCVLSGACHHSQVNQTLTVLHDTWCWATLSLSSHRGNVSCIHSWYWSCF